MTGGAARWASVEALFDAALERPPGERGAWVEAQSDQDPEVRDEVLAMLRAHEGQAGVLDRPVSVPSPPAVPAEIAAALADRYVLDQPLGEGGMATVYLAHERKHDRRVVIKVLRPMVAAWFGAERFRTEVDLAARLSHPHILGLLDSGEAGGFLYYVMPHLGGETLRTRLDREHRLAPADGVPLLRDVASALAYAHAAGVVHRDVKPENVLCVGGHAYLMDFGIARLVSAVGRRTAVGVVLGTPGYMAPEQQGGGATDHRTDLWAWGVVARETLLGTRDLAASFAAHPEIPADLAALVEQCRAVDPAERPASAGEVIARLGAAGTTGPGAAAPASRRGRWPWAVAALGVAAAFGWAWLGREPRLDPDRLDLPVAVAPLRNETGDSTLATWGRLAGDWITQGLQQTGRVTVVSWPAALDAADRAAAAGRGLVQVLREEAKAGTAVTGAYYLVGDRLRFQAEVVDARGGAMLGTVAAVEVARADAAEGVRLLRDRVMGLFATRTDERLRDLPGMAERAPTFEAYRAFDRGMRLYNQQSYRDAAATMEDAHALDTLFLSPLVYAATARWNTGDYGRVDSLVRHLEARRTALSEYDELQMEQLSSMLAGDGDAAYQAIRRAADLAPGSRSSYNAARHALTLNRPAEALALLRAIDPDRGLMRGWQSYWTQLTHALHLTRDHERELEAAHAMRQRHAGSRVATVLEARALAALGRPAAIDSLLESIGPLPPDTYWSQGAAMVVAGEELRAHGHSGWRPYLDRAIRWLGNQLARDPSNPSHRYWLGTALYDGGRFWDARPYLEGLVREFPARRDFTWLAAVVTARLGDSAVAVHRLGEPPAYDRGEHTATLARIAAIAGDPSRAIDLLSEALHQGVDGWAWLHASAQQELAVLAGDPRYQALVGN